MYNPTATSSNPLALTKTSVYLAITFMCFSDEVNSANKMIIRHCPSAKQKSNAIENK